jgi:hypothetical protein
MKQKLTTKDKIHTERSQNTNQKLEKQSMKRSTTKLK